MAGNFLRISPVIEEGWLAPLRWGPVDVPWVLVGGGGGECEGEGEWEEGETGEGQDCIDVRMS